MLYVAQTDTEMKQEEREEVNTEINKMAQDFEKKHIPTHIKSPAPLPKLISKTLHRSL